MYLNGIGINNLNKSIKILGGKILMDDNNISIYRIYNTITNKSYIGQTTKEFDERYYKGDFSISTTSQSLKNDYKLYGKEFFKHEILEKVTSAISTREEILYINLYDFLFGSYNTQMSHKKFNKLNNYKTVYYNISNLKLYYDAWDADHNLHIRDSNEIIYNKDVTICKCYNDKYIYLVPYIPYNKYCCTQSMKPLPLNVYDDVFGVDETIQENILHENDFIINGNNELLLHIIDKECGSLEQYRYKYIYDNNYRNLIK